MGGEYLPRLDRNEALRRLGALPRPGLERHGTPMKDELQVRLDVILDPA